MKKTFLLLWIYLFTILSFSQNIDVVARVDSSLEEISAIEKILGSNYYWVIEDSGNNNTLFAVDNNGNIQQDIEVNNAENDDWEDLTSDIEGNLFIGDFGNNAEERETFHIYKISSHDLNAKKVTAKRITFRLPEDVDSRDFEAFFVWNNQFYIFSKEKKKPIVIIVPNKLGTHVAKVIAELDFKGKDNEITSADISPDGQTIALLNHEKVWLLRNFRTNDFSKLTMHSVYFGHDSQKEGIYFQTSNTLYISDERDDNEGGRIYRFKLKN